MIAPEVRRAAAHELLDVRWRVLRAGRPRETAHFPGDDDAGTRHWGVWADGAVVACASVLRADEPGGSARWQLRGMAVDRDLHGRGYGAALLEAIHADVGEPMWCNAREGAVGFYRRLGWSVTSGRFEIEGVGPHHRMRWDGARVLHRGRHLELVARRGWEFVRRHVATGVVAIAALTDDGELVLVEQHREPLGRRVLELPAGLSGDGGGEEAALDAARRELLEETGFRAREWHLAATGPVSAGLTDEVVHLFVARGLVREGPGGGVDGEDIVVHLVPLDTLPAWLRGRPDLAVDHKVWSAITHLRHRDDDPEGRGP